MGIYIQATIGTDKYILEPSQGEDILLDISTIENGEIGEVVGDLSRSFSFPANAQNNKFFNQPFAFGFQDIPGTKDVIAITVESNIETLFHGTMTLDSWNESNNSYQCSITSGVITLNEALKDKELQDADWIDGVTYNMQTWKSTNEIAAGTYGPLDYYFPFVDLGFDKDGRPRIPADDQTAQQAIQRANWQAVASAGNPEDAQGNRFSQGYYYANNGQLIAPRSVVTPTTYHGEIGFGQDLQGYITSFVTPLRIEQLTPAIKLRRVIDSIFEQAGFTYTADDGAGGNFFSTMLQDVFVYPKLREGLGIEGATPQTGHQFIGTATNSSTTDLNPLQTVNTRNEDRVVYTFGTTTALATEVDPGNSWNTGVYTVSVPGTYEFQFRGELNDVTDRFDTSREYLQLKATIRVNGEIRESVALVKIEENYNNADNNWDFTASFNLQQGDTVSAAVYQDSAKSGHFGSTHSIEGDFDNVRFQTTQIPTVWEGIDVDFGAQFQGMLSIDMLRAIVQKFNLVIYADKNRPKHLIVQQYYDAILGGRRVDWSDRIDPETKTYTSLLSEQESDVLFTESEGMDRFSVDIDPAPGSVLFASEDGGVTSGEATIGEYFSPLITGTVNQVGDPFRNSTTTGASGIPHIYTIDGVDQESVDGGIYIGYNKRFDTPGTFFYADGTNSVSYTSSVRTISEYNEAGNRTLNWADDGNYQGAYNTYWKEYIDHLYNNNNQKLTVDVQLNPSEYKSLSWNDRIHIDGNDYLINKINGFNLNNPDVVEVELISYRNNFVNVFQPPTIQYVEPEDAFQRTYNLGIQVIGYDGPVAGGVTFDNPVIQQSITSHTVVGAAAFADLGGTVEATSEQIVVNVRQVQGFEINSTNFSGTTVPTGVVIDSIADNADGSVDITLTITIQNANVDALLVISGEVDRQLPGFTDFNITWEFDATFPTGATVTGLGDGRGQIGSSSLLLAQVTPMAGEQLDATTFAANLPLPTGVNSVTFTQFGTGLLATASVTFQNASTAATITIDGDDPTTSAGANTSQVTLDFTETITNVSSINDLVFTGVVGTRNDLSIPLYAADGYTLDSDNFSATSSETFVTMFDAVGGGETVQIPIAVTFPAANTVVNITLNGSAQEVGEETVDVVVTFSVPGGAEYSLTETTETFTGAPGTTLTHTNDVTPSNGFELGTLGVTTTGSITSTIGTGSDKALINSLITFPAMDGTATVSVTGATVREPYRLVINLTNNITGTMLSNGSITNGFGEQGQTFQVELSQILSQEQYSLTMQL